MSKIVDLPNDLTETQRAMDENVKLGFMKNNGDGTYSVTKKGRKKIEKEYPEMVKYLKSVKANNQKQGS